ncbi:MAG: PIN domain-containing protein [Candidatus Dormibacteria bacterium]
MRGTWGEVEEILRTGEPGITLVNLAEVAYILERTSGAGAADEVWANLSAESRPGGVPVCWIDINDTLVRRAAAIKMRDGMSYADAFAAPAASVLDCPVLTGDPEFRVAEEAGVIVRWLGRRAWRLRGCSLRQHPLRPKHQHGRRVRVPPAMQTPVSP